MSLKEHVERILKKKNISKGDLAGKMGAKSQRITEYLSGNPTLETLQKMAAALEVSVGDLLGETFQLRPEEGYVYLPILDIEASAGNGLVCGHEVPVEFIRMKEEDFRFDFHADPTKVSLIKVRGDSMLPHFSPGDWILVDTSDTEAHDGVYVINLNDHVLLKRLQIVSDGIMIKSDNPAYEPIKANGDFRICGRVIGQVVMKRL